MGYLGGPGSGCTSPARAISRSSGSKSGPVVSGAVGSALPRMTEATP